jgi:hypothetical protein
LEAALRDDLLAILQQVSPFAIRAAHPRSSNTDLH